MSLEKLKSVLGRTSEMEKLLTPMGGTFMPGIKTIRGTGDFEEWLVELKYQLQKAKTNPLTTETIQFIDSTDWNGWNDEKNFIDLKAKLRGIESHFDELSEVVIASEKLKKGTVIKTAFDEYTLIKEVGAGGNAHVFSATDKEGQFVAIKFVEKNIGREKLKRFKNEIYFCERHKHKNLVEILDRGYAFLNDKDYVFYVMPLYTQTLRAKIKDGILPEDAVKITVGILEGLQYAHSHETIHRDIKPENIMFAEGSTEPIICDFGIAHFAEEDLQTAVETRKGERMANFQYAAPEQRIKGGNIQPQTDIYAVGLMLNEMFTGEIPQASGYTKIADINEEYKYLDDVAEKMFQQKAEDRLYPEGKILLEMKLLAEQYQREKEKQMLEKTMFEMELPEKFEASIVGKDYKDSSLLFIFNRELPEAWVQVLKDDSYAHSVLIGYEPRHLKRGGKNEIKMRLRGSETKETLKMIVENVTDWVSSTNVIYSRLLKSQAEAELHEKEDARKKEMERLNKESALSALIKDL